MAIDRDYYAILQVSRSADQETIERAYKRLAGIYDPATSKKPRAAARMREIEEAYGVLGDKQGRAAYDRELGRRRAVAASAGLSTGVLMNRYLWMLSGGLVTGVAIVVALLIVLGGSGGSGNVVADPTVSISVTTPSPTPVGQTPGPTAPANPPAVSGEPITTASGLQYVDVTPGTGDLPKPGDTVLVNYTGWLQSDGTLFDSSLGRAPFPVVLGAGGVIEGWEEGLSTVQAGGTRRLIIPPELAYGEAGRGGIPPNATLVFDIDVLSISGPATPAPSAEPTASAEPAPSDAPTASP